MNQTKMDETSGPPPLPHSEVPIHLSARFIPAETAKTEAMRTLLQQNYFNRFPEPYLATELGQRDLANHVFNRLEMDRRSVIPWLDSVRPLKDSSLLEIGCGTGCSTFALAEQGARVTAVDVDKNSLTVAEPRCSLYGLEAQYFQANATEVHQLFSDQHFDFIIFYASLEHMTLAERLIAMKSTWEMLAPGDLWCVVETPNRLWYHDGHTSLLPFFFWLPDDLAYQYARFSARDNFRELYEDGSEESMLHFRRRGRGVSFHEFELTMKPVGQLSVVSSLSEFRRKPGPPGKPAIEESIEDRYVSFLREVVPTLQEGFCQPSLNLIISKD